MMEEDDDKSQFQYSTTQIITLAWISRCSASLSVIGSALIIFMILRRRKIRLALIHNQLIMCMSFIDILSSVFLGIGPAVAPREGSGNNSIAIGNDGTCAAQGFFITLGFAVPSYNAVSTKFVQYFIMLMMCSSIKRA